MKIWLALFALIGIGISTSVHAGVERIDSDTIRVGGDIDKSAYSEYIDAAQGGYSKLVVNSLGGFPSVALKIAEDVAKRNVTVVVDGVCLSACANYLAFSGDRLVVECGSFLGWHGTIDTPEEAVARMRAENKPEDLIEIYQGWLVDLKARERKFYESAGVDYRLLEDSVEIVHKAGIVIPPTFVFDDVTGSYTVSRTAALWIPTPDVLQEYGVDVSGFCQNYKREDIQAMLDEKGFKFPFVSGGKQRDKLEN